MPHPSSTASKRAVLFWYFAATYLALCWINAAGLDLAAASAAGRGALVFLLNAHLSYNAMYLMPAVLLTWLIGRPTLWRWLRAPERHDDAAQITAVLLGALTTLFFYANAQLHALYGMFVNGFVVNLLVTPGGLESLGGSAASSMGFVLIAGGFLLAHGLAMLALRRGLPRAGDWNVRRAAIPLLALFLLSTSADRAAYACANAFAKTTDMQELTQGVPYYVTFTARHFFRQLGYHINTEEKVASTHGQLSYPLKPLQIVPPAKRYNIVWLVSESWRADTLNSEIMPRTAAFAEQAQNFKLHYSGGNGTRIGIFTMMTGIPGSYWPAFYEGHRSAALMDVLQQQGYQMSLYTSARFSYPEFDQTIFSKLPPQALHWIDGPGAGWEKDRRNVSDMLDYIDKRDPARPFFTFMFFESPHARYFFPPESVIRQPYRDDINYATMDRAQLRRDIGLIKNRYLNAVHHLDSQFARVLDYLATHGLLDSTIVVMVGDHGEEFMENGYWGHNSTFSDPQVRTPLVLWVPGMAPAVHHKLTSHLDLPATLMPLLGVQNAPADYTVGLDLLSPAQHEYVTLSDWSHIAYRDSQVKLTLPTSAQGGIGKKISGPDDEKLDAAQSRALLASEQPHLMHLMQDLGRYTRAVGH